MYLRSCFLTFLFLIILSCSDKTDVFEFKQESISLSENIRVIRKNKEDINIDIGLWMFNNKTAQISSIANWIGIKLENKTIIEPINVIWVDFKATNKTEAKKNVTDFLFSNNFLIRSGSSIGYYGLFDNNIWIPQHMETWSDNANHITINNHGRIFLAHEVKDSSNNTVFVSTGAFSVENEKHYLISFHDALNDFKETNNWSLFKNNYQAKNIILNNNYTTFDHNGIKIFILN